MGPAIGFFLGFFSLGSSSDLFSAAERIFLSCVFALVLAACASFGTVHFVTEFHIISYDQFSDAGLNGDVACCCLACLCWSSCLIVTCPAVCGSGFFRRCAKLSFRQYISGHDSGPRAVEVVEYSVFATHALLL